MGSNFIRKVLSIWEKISVREQRLALLTLAVIILMLVVTLYKRAVVTLDDMDMAIARMEDDLVSYTNQIAHRELVESQYAKIAAQHSSQWTEAEIHDRLRQEIYRLASRTLADLDENGIPLESANEQGNLVEGISLGKGNMAEGGRGYREYRINVRIPPAPLEDLLQYLENLQESPQSLRLDAVELTRLADKNFVGASVDITRIVADGASEKGASGGGDSGDSGGSDTEEAPLRLGRIRLQAGAWQSDHAQLSDAESESAHGAIEVVADSDNASLFFSAILTGGDYELIIEAAAAEGIAQLAVVMEADDTVLSNVETVEGDGNLKRYQIQFTVAGTEDELVHVKCPLIRLSEKGTTLHVANLLIRAITEM